MRPAGPSSIETLELRRALLLFAIVLGVAALVTSVSNPADRERAGEPESAREPAPPPSGGPARTGRAGPVRVRFDSEARVRAWKLEGGRAATVTVAVGSPGEVRIEGLGLSAPAEQLTPARFELLPRRPGRHRVRFTPTGRSEARTVGFLEVESSR